MTPEILASEKIDNSVYQYIIVPETIHFPTREGFRIHMNVNGGPFELGGIGWGYKKEQVLERLAIKLAEAEFYKKSIVTIFSNELNDLFKIELDRLLFRASEAKRKAEIEEKEHQEREERIYALLDEVKTYKWKKRKNFRIASVKGKSEIVNAWILEGSGLGIHKSLSGKNYDITHERSMLKVAGNFPSVERAKAALIRLIKEFDWNISKEEIMKTAKERGAFVQKIQSDIFSNPLTVKGRKFQGNPPRKMYYLPYRYEVQFSKDDELFGEPLKFRSEQEISDFLQSYPRIKRVSLKKLEPKISDEENPPLHWDTTVGNLAEASGIMTSLLTYMEFADIPYAKIKKEIQEAQKLINDAQKYISQSHKSDFIFNPNPPVTEVYRDIIQIKARKKDGRLYQHNFKPGSHILGLSDGSLLVKSRKGKKLWKNFPKGRK